MKIKRVKSERDVKGGRFYIRAVVNPYGAHWTEVFCIIGKAFNAESKHMPGFRKLMTTREMYNSEYRIDSYVGDLGIGRRGGYLFEYSSKVHSYLKTLSLRQFNDVVNNSFLSDDEWAEQLSNWQLQKEMNILM